MEFSSKITHSICLHLESLGYMPGDFLECADITPEKAFDPENWIQANKVEVFLASIQAEIEDFNVKNVALQETELRGWGVLNQVLKILKNSSQIYVSPQNYLSYFVRPLNNFVWIEKTNENTVFKTALSSEDFPLVTDYLCGALEVVTKFVETEEETSEVFWTGSMVSIEWGDVDSVAIAVEVPEEEELEKQSEKKKPSEQQTQLVNSLKLLEDYFLRSRQLISLLKAESGKKRWFKKALQRLDWENLEEHFEHTVAEMYEEIERLEGRPGKSNQNQEIKTYKNNDPDEDFTLKMQ